jgi:hypothetical protein
MTQTHAKMLATRRRKEKARKKLARVAKLEKKLQKKDAKAGKPNAVKAASA